MRFTVVTASFNSQATIADTLQSVDRQEGVSVEHLIIDGASTDDTLRIIQQHHQPWRQVISEPDRGIYDAMNKGLRTAAGDIVGLLNSDDLYPTGHVLATVAKAFDSDPALDAVYGDLCYVRQHNIDHVVRYWRSSAYQPGRFERGWVPPHPTFFARKEVYERLGCFDLTYRLAADWELLVRLIEVGKIRVKYLPEVLVHMRLGGATNKSLSNVWKQNREIWRAAQAHALRPSISGFVLGKVWSRGMQFVMRST
jgi:glycosyltransferase involved in cell wall biosynthesis